MVATFAGLGMAATATKYVAEFRTKDPVRTGQIILFSELITILVSAAAAALLVIFAPEIATHSFSDRAAAPLLQRSAALLFFTAVANAASGALTGLERFRDLSMITLVGGIATIVAFIPGCYWYGTKGALWGLAIGSAVTWLLTYIRLKTVCASMGIPLSLRIFQPQWQILWRFGIPSLLGSAMIAPVTWASTAFLVRSSRGYGEMSLFNAANQWRIGLMFLPATLGNLLLPVMANLFAQDEHHDSFLRVVIYGALVNVGVMGICAAMLIIFSRYAMCLFGVAFTGGTGVLVFLALSMPVTAFNNHCSRVLSSTGQMWQSFSADLTWGAMLLLTSLLLIPRHGARGLGEAYLAASLAQVLCISIYLWRTTKRVQNRQVL
jgi:O-antigen/teichoic acid export membrane protein